MPVLVLKKCVASLLAVERDNCPTVPKISEIGEIVSIATIENECWPHSNPGVVLLVPEPVRVAGVTVRPGLDLMVKPDLNNSHWVGEEMGKSGEKSTSSLRSARRGHFWARRRAGFRFSHTHSPPASLHLRGVTIRTMHLLLFNPPVDILRGPNLKTSLQLFGTPPFNKGFRLELYHRI